MTAVIVTLVATLAAAEPPVIVGLPASQPAIPGLDGDIRKVFDRAFQQYANARSYEDSLVASLELDFEGPAPLQPPEPEPMSLAYERAGRLAIRTPLYHIICDGKTLREAVAPWMQYVEAAAPKTLDLAGLVLGRFQFFDASHPLAALLLRPGKPTLEFLGNVTKLVRIRPDAMNGRPGQRVTGLVQKSGVRSDFDLEIWFDDKTGLIGEIVYDQTKAVQPGAARQGIKVKKYLQRYRFNESRVNEAIPDSRFALAPEPNMDKVADLKKPSSHELQQRMTGRPAPAFTGTDLEGKSLQSADLKDRVVLLDFWSLGCRPCIMSMPALQKVADKYAGKPVSVIGVNLDGALASDRIVALLKQGEIKFRQLIQTRPALDKKYFVQGIPCTILLDGRGTVQMIHMGLADESQLTDQIDRLLKGETLYAKK